MRLKRLSDIQHDEITGDYLEEFPTQRDLFSDQRSGAFPEGYVGVWDWHVIPNKKDPSRDFIETSYSSSQPTQIIIFKECDSVEKIIKKFVHQIQALCGCLSIRQFIQRCRICSQRSRQHWNVIDSNPWAFSFLRLRQCLSQVLKALSKSVCTWSAWSFCGIRTPRLGSKWEVGRFVDGRGTKSTAVPTGIDFASIRMHALCYEWWNCSEAPRTRSKTCCISGYVERTTWRWNNLCEWRLHKVCKAMLSVLEPLILCWFVPLFHHLSEFIVPQYKLYHI